MFLQQALMNPDYVNVPQMMYGPLMHAACRNLVSRVHFAACISRFIISWYGDCAIITLRRDKSNQEGDDSKVVKRHVYCNVLEPWGDFILHLAIRVFSCLGFLSSPYICGDEMHLGTTKSKDGAFGELLKNTLEVTIQSEVIDICIYISYIIQNDSQ